ncbi:hypothetical protein FE80_13885 [Staphylococcus aureus]|nr:hypothetical protein FE76_07960 [Staphylococcus aureus]KMS35861.1 hypothetical protein FE80_13885 [Staphylococcus aureus]PBI70264.1 hypothetical protein APW28_13790 [Staphylococcus aureus]QBS22649.1 hypothetical protein B9T41_00440 [Staphylococcus aureus]
MPKNVIYVIRVESVEAFQKLFRKVSKIKNGSGTEIIFSQNLFRCITPARMTRFEKSLIQAHFQISQLLTK